MSPRTPTIPIQGGLCGLFYLRAQCLRARRVGAKALVQMSRQLVQGVPAAVTIAVVGVGAVTM